MDTILSERVGFNPAPPTVMHIDLNSCFASVEQQANPRLRGKPVAVAAYVSDGGCILAASREAKKLGVTTGLRVRDGRALCPDLVVLPPDPNKYRFVNRQLLQLLQQYTADLEVKSIDEMVLNFRHTPSIQKIFRNFRESGPELRPDGAITGEMMHLAGQIKHRIRTEIGDWLTVSVGISTNRFLAKTASNLHKPDGLDVICGTNVTEILSGLKLEDLCGIKSGYGSRLKWHGIDTPLKFYHSDIRSLRTAFSSIVGYYWWLKLHGWEADDRQFGRKSYGHSHALYEPYATRDWRLWQILCQLVSKMGHRLRRHNYQAGGIHLACLFADYSFWHQSRTLSQPVYADADLYGEARHTLAKSPDRPVRIISVACFGLSELGSEQLCFFADNARKRNMTRAVDRINERWGDFTVCSARMLKGKRQVLDRIAFGGVKELEELISANPITHE